MIRTDPAAIGVWTFLVRSRVRILIAINLVLLASNLVLVIGLGLIANQLRQAEAQGTRLQATLVNLTDAIERGPLDVPIALDADLPVRSSLRLRQTFQFPIQTEVPIRTQIDVPFNTPLGNFSVPLPISLTVPVNLVVPIAVDEEVPISTTVPISINRAIQVDLRQTPLVDELRRLRNSLASQP